MSPLEPAPVRDGVQEERAPETAPAVGGIDLLETTVSESPPFFDPLSTEELTRVICRRFEEEDLIPMVDLPMFPGAGLYAIYYEGSSQSLYAPLRGLRIPVYVGQALSHNSATGREKSARPLAKRVREHRKSIAGTRLRVADFRVCLLRMPDVHVSLGENGLLTGYRPVWNSVLRGFGSHEQGSSTRQSAKTRWDTVHPGRSRTAGPEVRHKARKLREEVRAAVAAQVESAPTLWWRGPR